jgi:hypothetical protein
MRVDQPARRRRTPRNYWTLSPDLVRPAALVPSAHVDTVVLEQVCDIQTSLRADVKQALVAWVANGNKLIISDADSCGPGNVPDYSFLPYRFATSNPGGRAAASAVQVVEQNFLVSPDSHNPAFFDETSWRLKRNGNASNDFGDSNTVVQYDDHWCGVLFGTNAIGGSGFVMAYAHYGRGVIIYDGIDRDQYQNLAYQQYAARQLLLPFRPDPLPCTLRVRPRLPPQHRRLHPESGASAEVADRPRGQRRRRLLLRQRRTRTRAGAERYDRHLSVRGHRRLWQDRRAGHRRRHGRRRRGR